MPGQPALIMIQGPEPGSYCKLPDNRVTTIGRSSRNTLRVVNPSVSRFHCEIGWVNGAWVLTDLNSKKGTIVNGESLKGRKVLRPGDIIRLSSVVFRFDLVAESPHEDGALVAIKEAEIDHKLRTRGETTGSLDDIRARTRLAAEAARKAAVGKTYPLRKNLLFLGAVAGISVLLAAALLFYAHRRASGALGDTQWSGRSAWGEAQSALQEGRSVAGLRELRRLSERVPRTPLVARAAQEYRRELWRLVEDCFAAAAAAEGEGDYKAAIAAYSGLEKLDLPEAVAKLYRSRRRQTEKLARAALRDADRRAERLLEEGKKQQALRVYMEIKDRLGLEELRAEASARVARLKANP